MSAHTAKITTCVPVVLFILIVCLGGCQEAEPVNVEPDETLMPAYINGQDMAKLYLGGQLTDYEVVAALYALTTTDRQLFLNGFAQTVNDDKRPSDAVTYKQILAESVTGNQFSRASEMGSKHVLQSVTNEQVQGVVHSTLGVSRGVVLGWKAGYIKGFTAQRVAQSTAKGSVDEGIIQGHRLEAAAAYYALRASIGG